MTTLNDRPNSALLVIDMQVGVVAGAHGRAEMVANVATLVQRARSAAIAVIWVQHDDEHLRLGTDDWRLVAELKPLAGEPLVHKHYGDAFEATNLESELARLGVGRVVVAGAQTDACVRSTLHGAFTRGYDTTLVADAHTTEDLSAYGAPAPDQVIAHTNLYWGWQSAPGRRATVEPTRSVRF